MTGTVIQLAPGADETMANFLRRMADDLDADGRPARGFVVVERTAGGHMAWLDVEIFGLDRPLETIGMMDMARVQTYRQIAGGDE